MTVLSPRAALRTAGTGALLALFVAVGATAAHAHDDLLDSSPGPGEHLDVAPAYVTLSFSDDILTIGPAVVVADASGATWTAGAPALEGSAVVTPLLADVPDGAYEVRWRVVSSDGHPISGVVPFTVGDATTADAPGAAVPPAAPDTTGPATPPEAVAASGSSTSPSWLRPVLVGGVGALVASALFWTASYLLRRPTVPTPHDGSS